MTTHKDTLRKANNDLYDALDASLNNITNDAARAKVWRAWKSLSCEIEALAAQPEQQPVAQSEMEKFDSYMMAAFGKGNRQLRAEAYTWDDMASCWYASNLQNAIDAARNTASPIETAAKEGWISVKDRLPDEETICLVFVPESANDHAHIRIDYFCDGCWNNHNDHYEHFMAIGGPSAAGPDCICTGPSADAPYTHWMTLPAAPQPPQENKA